MKWMRAAGAGSAGLALMAASVATLPMASANPADGRRVDHRRCVTHGEYRSLHDELTLGRVKRILDGPGKVVRRDGGRHERRWFVCGGGRETKVWVWFYYNGSIWREDSKHTNAS